MFFESSEQIIEKSGTLMPSELTRSHQEPFVEVFRNISRDKSLLKSKSVAFSPEL